MKKKNQKTEKSVRMIDINGQMEPVESSQQQCLSVDEIIRQYGDELTRESKTVHFDKARLIQRLQAVKGQQDNVSLIVDRIHTWMRQPKKEKPLVFMLAGTSGTGKSFTAKTIADMLGEDGYKYVPLYMNDHSDGMGKSKLIGSGPGYVNSNSDAPLFAARKSSSKLVILFDEIEKAHHEIPQMLMTLLDEGKMTNGKGEVFNFTDSIIFFTTNLAMNQLLAKKKAHIAKGTDVADRDFQDDAKEILKRNGLRTEISGRINWLLVYNALDSKAVAEIAIDQIRRLGEKYDININRVESGILMHIVSKCTGSDEGARPVGNMVSQIMETALQDAYERDDYNSGAYYDVVMSGQNLSCLVVKSDAKEILPADDMLKDIISDKSGGPEPVNETCVKAEGLPVVRINSEPFCPGGYNYDEYRKAMGLIKLNGGDDGTGSGFLISSDGYVMTCAHCTTSADITFVKDDDKTEYKASVVYKNEQADIAILKIDASDMPYLTITDRDRPLKIGTEVVILGYPSGTDINTDVSAFEGRVSNIDKDRKAYQTDAIATKGSSGGAFICKADGIVYGVLRGGYDVNINVATDIRNLLRKADEELTIEYV